MNQRSRVYPVTRRVAFIVLCFTLSHLYGAKVYGADLDRAKEYRLNGQIKSALALLQNESKRTLEETAFLAKLYMDIDDYKSAQYYYNQSCPGLNQAWCFNEWGVSFMMSGVHQNAWRAFLKAVEMEPSNSRYHSNLGLCYYYRRKIDEAKKHYKLALEFDPSNDTARINHAVLLIRERELTEAVDLLNQVVSRDDSNYFAHFYLGYAYFKQKQYRQSIEQYTQALQINSGVADIYVYRAYAYYEAGNIGEAEADLNRAEALRPNHPKAAVLRSVIERRNRY